MKILIADDMEGISGVVDWSHVDSNNPEYSRFRKIMTDEINTAIDAAFKAGADEVVVADGHGSGRNVLVENLDKRARLNSGTPSPYGMITGINENVDAMILIGYHARAGSLNAILCHTWSGNIYNVWLNDMLVGEIGLNSSLAGFFNVPVILISSDQAGCDEAAALLPGIKTVAVKQGLGRHSADCLPPKTSHKKIFTAVEAAVKKFKKGQHPAVIQFDGAIKLTVELKSSKLADSASVTPGAERIDGRTLSVECNDMVAAYRAFQTIAGLARD
ncbi:MAG: M55 family metallopeptidase [Anaerolineaceae bacterium]|nr:M55 family metallopeptidase [Anaerolineaceae bacterium]